MSDPEASMFSILKPYQGFEETYQGETVDTPIPLTPVIDDQVLVEENPGAPPMYDPKLVRYLSVPLGSTLLIWFPRLAYVENGEFPDLIERPYRYQLRWRVRSVQDFMLSRERVYALNSSLGGHTSQSGTVQQMVIPACMGDVIEPAPPTNSNLNLGLNYAKELLSDSEGFYGDAVISGFPNFIRGPMFYPPYQVPALGNELAIYAYRQQGEASTWDFDGADQGFSLYYGVGRGSNQHTWYPSHGIYVSSMGRSTYP